MIQTQTICRVYPVARATSEVVTQHDPSGILIGGTIFLPFDVGKIAYRWGNVKGSAVFYGRCGIFSFDTRALASGARE